MDPEVSSFSVSRLEDVEPDFRYYLDELFVEWPDFSTASADDVRQYFASMRVATEVPEVASVVDASFVGPEGPVDVRIYRAVGADAVAPTLVWFHGGGWVLGDLETAELPCRALCREAGLTVISVDYRLAPEATFPAPYEDCLAAVHWVCDNAADLGVDRDRIVVGGDSAGGNLAAAVANACARTDVVLAGQLLVYPVTEEPIDDYGPVERGYGLDGDSMRWFWNSYVPDAAERSDPRATPANDIVTGVAPAFVQTCGFDPLAAEGLRYVQILETNGVEVVADHEPGAIHGAFAMPIECGARMRSTAARWLRDLLASVAT